MVGCLVCLYLIGSFTDIGHAETRMGGVIEGEREQQVQRNL